MADPTYEPADHCEAETSWGDRCSIAVAFRVRCRNSGSTYDVCRIHRRTAVARGDSLVGRLHRCPSCDGHGWVIDKAAADG